MYSCTSTNTLLKHTIKEHKNDPNFLVHCTICGKSFNKWNSFQRHVKRKHKYEQNRHDDDDEDDDRDSNADQADQQLEDLNNVNIVEPEMNTIDEMQWHAAKFVLNLKEKCKVTQVAVNQTIDTTKDLVGQVVGVIKKRLWEKCDDENIDFSDIENDGEGPSLFDTSFLFEDVNSEYLQKKFFEEKFNLVVSIHVVTYIYDMLDKFTKTTKFGSNFRIPSHSGSTLKCINPEPLTHPYLTNLWLSVLKV